MTSLPPRVDLVLLRMQAILGRFGAAPGGAAPEGSDFRTVLQDALGSEPGPAPLPPEGRLGALVRGAAREAGIDPDLLMAVLLSESGGDPHAVSPAGAAGLMQLMPATARELGVSDVFDPSQNVRAGAQYLRAKLSEFGGDLGLALAAYNAGSGAVHRWGGIPPYEETRAYVARVLAVYHRLRTSEAAPSPDRRPAQDASGPDPLGGHDRIAPPAWLPPAASDLAHAPSPPRGEQIPGALPRGEPSPPDRLAPRSGPAGSHPAPKVLGPTSAARALGDAAPLGEAGGDGGPTPPSVPQASPERWRPALASVLPDSATVQVLPAGVGSRDQNHAGHPSETEHGGVWVSDPVPGSLSGMAPHDGARDPGPPPGASVAPERPGAPPGPPPQIRLLVASQDLGRIAVRLAESPGGVTAHVVASDRAGALLAWRASDLREALQGYGVPLASLMIARVEDSLGSPRGHPDERAPGGQARPRVRTSSFTLES